MPDQEIDKLFKYLRFGNNADKRREFVDPETRLAFLKSGYEAIPQLSDDEIARLMIAKGDKVPDIFENFKKI